MVQRLHQSNGYGKKKLQVWRAQKNIALVGAETVFTSAGPQTTPFHGLQYSAENGNIRYFGSTNPHGLRLHQGNDYIKRKLRVSRTQKCIALVSAETVLTSAGLQTIPFHAWQYRDENGNMRNFVPTNPHVTAFAPKQWLYQKKATVGSQQKIQEQTNSTQVC